MKILTVFLLVLATVAFSVVNNYFVAAKAISGGWSIPELTPPARSLAAMKCSTTFQQDPFTGEYSTTVSLQLLGGRIQSNTAVQTTYNWFSEQSQWFPQQNALPAGRAGFAVFSDDVAEVDTAYFFGGTDLGDTLADNFVYKSQYGTPWEKILQRKKTKRDAPPLTRFGSWLGYINNTAQAPQTNGAMFVWGGLGAGGVSPSLYWFAFDDSTDKGLRWGEAYKVVAGGPTARYDHCCAALGHPSLQPTDAICFGGAGLETDYNDVWKVNWAACDQAKIDDTPWTPCAIWTLLHSGNLTQAALAGDDFPPTPRRSSGCAYVYWEDALYVHGGFDVNSGKAVNDSNLYRFDVATNKWARSPQVINQTAILANNRSAGNGLAASDLLTPRYGASMTTCLSLATGQSIHLFGGIDSNGAASGDTFQLDLGFNAQAFPNHDRSPLLFKKVDSSERKRPVGRSEHVAVLSQGQLIVLFGRSTLSLTSALGDVWSYNISSKIWTEINLIYDESTLLKADIPRTGAAAMEFRSGVLIFGGQDVTGISTNDLLVLQPLTGEIRKIIPTSTTTTSSTGATSTTTIMPAPRSYHVMVRLGDFVVIGTGWSEDNGFFDDWWRYNAVDQSWLQLAVSGDVISGRLAMASLERYNETHTVVGGGIGARVFADFYFLSLDEISHSTLRINKIALNYSSVPGGERGVIRAYGTLAGTGNHLVVCGGAISETDPALYPDCYQIDLSLRNISVLNSPYLPAVYGTATMVENNIILFGGQQTTDTSFTDKFIDTPQIFSIFETCPENAPHDNNCVKCSKGFKNVGTVNATCQVAPPGTYITDGLSSFVQCDAGTYSRSIAAFSADTCLPCAIGSYNPTPGATNCTPCDAGKICLAGSKAQITASSLQGKVLAATLSRSGLLYQDNPKPYSPLSIPWMPILVISLTAIILTAIVTAVLIVAHWVWIKRRDYYVPAEIQQQLENIYLEHAKAIRGMSEKEFIQATFSENFPQHDASILAVQRLFKELNVNGIGALNYYEFVEAFVLLVSRGHMKPLPGSKRVEEGKDFDHWAAPLIGSWDVRNFDNFANDHMTATVGKKILTQQISYGGAASLFFYVATIILILAIIINFFYNNTTESKGSVIHSVIQSSFGSQFTVQSDFVVAVTVLGPVRSLANISTLQDACLANAATQTCRSSASVTVTNVITSSSKSIAPITCSYDQKTGCTLTWTCTGCTITEGSTGSLLVRIAPQLAATTIDVSVSVTTGIRDPVMNSAGHVSMVGGPNQLSQVISRAVPTVSTEVLTGFPASVASFGLTPSFYEADEVDSAVNSNAQKYRATGYHARQLSPPLAGNAVPTELFSQYFDSPITIDMTTDEVPLLVRRTFTQTIVQLITSLLGAIAGLSGGLLAAVQFLDSHTGMNDNSDEIKHDNLENENEVAGLTDTYVGFEKLMTAEEFQVARPIIEKGIQPEMAIAFLEVLRRRRATGGKGNGVRIAGRHKSITEANRETGVSVVTGTEIPNKTKQIQAYSPRNADDNNNNNHTPGNQQSIPSARTAGGDDDVVEMQEMSPK